jgi:hypothetical protein
MVAAYGHSEARVLRLGLTLKGGLPALSGGPDGRAVVVAARVVLLPGPRPAGQAVPPGVTPAPEPGAAPAAAGARKPNVSVSGDKKP